MAYHIIAQGLGDEAFASAIPDFIGILCGISAFVFSIFKRTRKTGMILGILSMLLITLGYIWFVKINYNNYMSVTENVSSIFDHVLRWLIFHLISLLAFLGGLSAIIIYFLTRHSRYHKS